VDGSTTLPVPAAPPVRVLVADDEDDIRAVVCPYLVAPVGVAALVREVRALTTRQPA
jgi:hypothetical protein